MKFWNEIVYWEFIYIAGLWLTWNVLFTSSAYVFKQHKRRKEIQASIMAFYREQQTQK